MRAKARSIIVLCMAVVSGCAFLSCQERNIVRLGFVGGLTGRNGDLGTAGRDGALLAVETINAGGGVNGRKIELVIRDDKSDPEEAKKVVNELVSTKVTAIVGPMTSVVAMATVPIINSARMLMLSPTVSTTELTGKDDYFVRLIVNQDTAEATAAFIAEKLGIRRVAVLYEISNRSYTGTMVDAFKGGFTARNGSVVLEKTFVTQSAADFWRMAKEVHAHRPQAVFIVAGALDSAMICQQLRKAGSIVPIFISQWGGTMELIKGGGKAVEGVQFFQHYNSGSTAPLFTDFARRYQARYGDPPSFAGAFSYEAVMILADALSKNADPVRLKDTVITIGTYRGLQGPIVLDRFGDASRAISRAMVRGGMFVAQE